MTATECKMSKQGWPLGVYRHRLSRGCYDFEANRLISALAGYLHFNSDKFEAESDGSSNWMTIYVTAKMSMEVYGRACAFIEGWSANR